MIAEAVLKKLFGAPEEINGRGRCPTYLYRWFLMRTRWFKVYLHHFVADDWSLDLHDHPKRFISIGLKGSYLEWTSSQRDEFTKFEAGEWPGYVRKFRAPWIRSFPAEHIHRIEMLRNPDGTARDCWTLVIVLRGTREWGFWHRGQFIHWRKYVQSKTADEMKACGNL